MERQEITRHLTHLTNTVTTVLAWLQAAEEHDGVPAKGTLGTLIQQSKVDRIGAKMSGVQEALNLLEASPDLPALQGSLERSLQHLNLARRDAMEGRYEG